MPATVMLAVPGPPHAQPPLYSVCSLCLRARCFQMGFMDLGGRVQCEGWTIFITPNKKCCLTQKGSRSALSNHQEAVTKGACSLTHGVTTQQTPLILSCLIPFTFSHIRGCSNVDTYTLSKLNKAILFKPKCNTCKVILVPSKK